jgi:hypothetical protein
MRTRPMATVTRGTVSGNGGGFHPIGFSTGLHGPDLLLVVGDPLREGDGMRHASIGSRVLGVFLFLWIGWGLRAEHRATLLGHPSARFAEPLVTAEDLRWRFRDPALKPDILEILRQWGWKGRPEDLFHAADTAEILPMDIPVGTRMPFMSSRKSGRPVCLVDVVWAGARPAPAYAFQFTSVGRRYRCVTPAACSNFYLEDLGVEPRPALAVECSAPVFTFPGRKLRVCYTVRNTGDGVEPRSELTFLVPPPLTVAETTGDGVLQGQEVVWQIEDLGPGESRELCAFLPVEQLGNFVFNARLRGSRSPTVSTSCQTEVRGVSAILLEVIDVEDPVEVGGSVTYEIRVLNQGSSVGTNIRLRCMLPPSQEYISGSGATDVRVEGSVLTMEPIRELGPKETAGWRLLIRAVSADDARFQVELSSDQFELPIRENESTQQY